MQSEAELRSLLSRIDHRGYPAYKDTKGQYRFPGYVLSIDHVQGDPFASPSKVSIHVEGKAAAFPSDLYCGKDQRIALQDELTRQFAKKADQFAFQAKGSGKSGMIAVSRCGQEVLERTACRLDPNSGDIILRMEIGFPANGRTINARELEKILFQFVPECVKASLFYKNADAARLRKIIDLAEDQRYIRDQLPKLGLCAFVANGSILPRESGVSSKPMRGAVKFQSPKEQEVTITLPHAGVISGMGIKRGITLIVGGGYHGKSTLLKALETGVYPHVAGDGREYVITDDTAVKIRAEDGRSIKKTDISMFINDLPNGKDTVLFCTEDASGSTSQAAGIIEGMEAGSKVFLLDEDTSATNFMVRDTFMQEIISREKEPITPFLERAQKLYTIAGISTLLVAGSSGAFFHIADTVIQMDSYHPVDISTKVRALCEKYPLTAEKAPAFVMPDSHRIIQKNTPVIHSHGHGTGKPDRLKIKVHGKAGFLLGRQEVDLRYVEQLIDPEQTAALGLLLKYALEHLADGKKTMPEIVDYLQKQIHTKGLIAFADGSYLPCGYAIPRIQEIYSCFNRYRQ